MNTTELKSAVEALQTKLVEKTGKQPYIDLSLTVPSNSNNLGITWYGDGIDDWHHIYAPTIEELLAEAEAQIEAIDPERDAQVTFLQKLARLIDEAPLQVDTASLRDLQTAVTNNINLIAAE